MYCFYCNIISCNILTFIVIITRVSVFAAAPVVCKMFLLYNIYDVYIGVRRYFAILIGSFVVQKKVPRPLCIII